MYVREYTPSLILNLHYPGTTAGLEMDFLAVTDFGWLYIYHGVVLLARNIALISW
jgi:hypothetical protein